MKIENFNDFATAFEIMGDNFAESAEGFETMQAKLAGLPDEWKPLLEQVRVMKITSRLLRTQANTAAAIAQEIADGVG